MRADCLRALLTLALLLPAALAATPRARADQEIGELLEEALDQQVREIAIRDQPIPDALKHIEQQTGVRFEVDERVFELMPYGPRTRVSIQVKDAPLRTALRQMLDRLALAMRVADEKLRIEPAPVLLRLGRRATWEEMTTIQTLASDTWTSDPVKALKFRYLFPPEAGAPERLDATIRQVASGAALADLEAAARTLGWVWRPAETSIAICSSADYFSERLAQPMEFSFQRRPLDEVFVEIGKKAGVPMLFEPGSLQRVAAPQRHVDLIQRKSSARQALELLCGRTGLQYAVVADGVRISGPVADSTPSGAGDTRSPPGALGAGTQSPSGAGARLSGADAAAPLSASAMAVRISIPLGAGGASVDFFIPEECLPPELRGLRDQKLNELIALLRSERAAKP
ncbi:MAG: hypothetical protein CHACPFDD_00359 [Phycisphaerae bacterium]|nr:hypothetical protein [Phycisphaerae bacterium]